MSRKQPLDFRVTEVAYVMQRWQAAESCSIVGIGSVGKSNLIQHLTDVEVQQHYLGDKDASQFKAVLIDPNMMGALPDTGDALDQIRCWAGYELMMHRLFLSFYPLDILGTDDARRFFETYQMLQDGTNPLYAYMGLRYFELGLQFFLRRGLRIVFMFDEFEDLLHQMPVRFFQNLRGLRDTHKTQLSYMTFTRSPLPVLVDRYSVPTLAVEPFVELFTDNVYYVGPYNDADAHRMADRLMKRRNKPLSESMSQFLLEATGCYAGLMRAAFHLAEQHDGPRSTAEYDHLLAQLAINIAIRAECRTIWTSLTPSEQFVLKAAGRLHSYSVNAETEQAVLDLVQKRLLRLDRIQNVLEIHPPLFRLFVAGNPEADV
jgi:hypothetical protein